MWYRTAAYGTIDLQKYISENEGPDYDFESELQALLKSGIRPNFGVINFHKLNENLEKSKLKNYISQFVPIGTATTLAIFDPITHEVGLRDLQRGDTVDDMAQSIKHELRHSVDKGRGYRQPYINDSTLNMATEFFQKYKDVLVDPETKQLKYDRDKLILIMINDYLFSRRKDQFEPLSNDQKAMVISEYINSLEKTSDQVYEVFQRLANGQDAQSVINYYNFNDPQEYSTFLSDINDFFSPQAFKLYFDQLSYMEREKLIESMRYTLTRIPNKLTLSTLNNINYEGEHLVSKILYFSENEQMKRNVYKILNKNFQEFLSEYTKEEVPSPDQFKEAKNDYNAPRTGKKKKRWSVKYKKSIDCNNPKGFSQKNYCKRKRRGGNYKTES